MRAPSVPGPAWPSTVSPLLRHRGSTAAEENKESPVVSLSVTGPCSGFASSSCSQHSLPLPLALVAWRRHAPATCVHTCLSRHSCHWLSKLPFVTSLHLQPSGQECRPRLLPGTPGASSAHSAAHRERWRRHACELGRVSRAEPTGVRLWAGELRWLWMGHRDRMVQGPVTAQGPPFTEVGRQLPELLRSSLFHEMPAHSCPQSTE